MQRLTVEAALKALEQSGGRPYATLFERGTLEVEIYRPDQVDAQTPHDQDEVYVVISGRGVFECDGVRQPFAANDVLFAPAGVPHRFVDFSVDFLTWVIFYGPEGGEAPK